MLDPVRQLGSNFQIAVVVHRPRRLSRHQRVERRRKEKVTDRAHTWVDRLGGGYCTVDLVHQQD